MLTTRIEKMGEAIVVQVYGNIVVGPLLRGFHGTVMSQSDASVVIIDLGNVSKIDAAGVGILLQLREQVQSHGGEFRLMNVTELVEQVLEISHLDAVFEVVTPEEVRPPKLVVSPAESTVVGSRLAEDLKEFFETNRE